MNPKSDAPKALLASLLRCVPGVVYRCGNDRDMTPEFFSEGVYGLTGYSPEDFVSGRIRRADLVVTEDRARILAETQAALAARLPFTLEYRLRTADGGEKWVREHSHGVFAPDGTMQALDGFIEDITERRRNDQALRRQTERLRMGQATARMIVMDWDASTDTIDWSDSPEWLRGPLPPSGQYPLYKDQVHPDDRGRWLAVRKDWIDNLKGEEIDYRVVRTDGVELWVHSRRTAFAGLDGKAARILVALHDITERVIAEQQARAADERLRSAIEHLGESIAVMDAEDRIVVANRYFRELNGNTHLVEPGRLYEEHLRAGMAVGNYPEAIGREEAWLSARLARHRAGGTVEVRRQDGKWLQVTDQRLPDGGMVSFALDLTARKEAEEAMRSVNANLARRVAERTAEVEASNRELESFSYSVSHDLRAPLRAVTGFARMLLQEEAGKLSAEGQRYLGVIDTNARRMGQLIDALLALGRYTRVALDKTEVDMARLAREACDELAASWPAAQITVGPLPRASGNPMLLKQVFLNLVGNGLKYSANTAAPRIEIRAEENRYIVSDNGAGFDMAYVGKLFQPFERLHTVQEFEGTGIGLAIVKRIVERHGGRVEAHGVPGEGASFSFTLGDGGGV